MLSKRSTLPKSETAWRLWQQQQQQRLVPTNFRRYTLWPIIIQTHCIRGCREVTDVRVWRVLSNGLTAIVAALMFGNRSEIVALDGRFMRRWHAPITRRWPGMNSSKHCLQTRATLRPVISRSRTGEELRVSYWTLISDKNDAYILAQVGSLAVSCQLGSPWRAAAGGEGWAWGGVGCITSRTASSLYSTTAIVASDAQTRLRHNLYSKLFHWNRSIMNGLNE